MQYDCHVEVFDPVRWCHSETPDQPMAIVATVTHLKPFLRASKVRAPVFVQPLAYRGSHGCLLNALQTTGAHARAVGHLSMHVPGVEIEALHRRGVRGTRFVMDEQALLDDLLDDLAAIHQLLPAVWHIELSGPRRQLFKLAAKLAHWNRNFVGVATDMWKEDWCALEAARVLWWMEMGNLYLKLVLPSQTMLAQAVAKLQPSMAKMIPVAADRLLWGSGWPHTASGRVHNLQFDRCHRTPAGFAHTLDANARAVYGFADASSLR